MSTPEPFKVGTHKPGEGIVEFRFEGVWQLEGDHLRIAPRDNQLGLLLDLAAVVCDFVVVSYTLLVPFREFRAGEHRLGPSMPISDVRAVFSKHRSFLESDARHAIEVACEDARVIYDDHNVIEAFGPPNLFLDVLARHGLVEGEVVFPFPHTHHTHEELDDHGVAFLSEPLWIAIR